MIRKDTSPKASTLLILADIQLLKLREPCQDTEIRDRNISQLQDPEPFVEGKRRKIRNLRMVDFKPLQPCHAVQDMEVIQACLCKAQVKDTFAA